MRISLEKTHKLVTINQTTDDQPNYIAKGIKIPTVHNQWSWTPLSNSSSKDYSLNKRKNNNDEKNSTLYMKD